MTQPPARLLVVDDNELNRDMLSRRLERRGFQVECAESGERALEMIERGDFGLVLLDIMMPGLSGIEVLARIRARHSITELPVIMATAKSDRATVVGALERGANDYVTKPLVFEEVLARVQTQLAIRRQARVNSSSSGVHKLEPARAPRALPASTDRYCLDCLVALEPGAARCDHCAARRPVAGWPRTRPGRYPYLGQIIGRRFFMERFLGEGTSGEVYAARDVELGRRYAAKIIRARATGLGVGPAEVLARARVEVEAMVRLQNPHVVKIYEVIEVEETTFALVMDYVRGLSLGSVLAQLGRLKPALALDLVRQVAQGIYEAHTAGIVHCDIKPDNVMLEKLPAGGYFVQVLDFGIARIGEETSGARGFYGTPLYSPPERIREDMSVDHRADIYSIGAMLFHMITGEPPFIDDDIYKVFGHHLGTPTPSLLGRTEEPSIEPALDALLQSMMAKSVASRPHDLLEVVRAIDAITASRGAVP